MNLYQDLFDLLQYGSDLFNCFWFSLVINICGAVGGFAVVIV
jgi:hypothetical protein